MLCPRMVERVRSFETFCTCKISPFFAADDDVVDDDNHRCKRWSGRPRFCAGLGRALVLI